MDQFIPIPGRLIPKSTIIYQWYQTFDGNKPYISWHIIFTTISNITIIIDDNILYIYIILYIIYITNYIHMISPLYRHCIPTTALKLEELGGEPATRKTTTGDCGDPGPLKERGFFDGWGFHQHETGGFTGFNGGFTGFNGGLMVV